MPQARARTTPPKADPFAWCRRLVRDPQTFDPLNRNDDAAVYAELSRTYRPRGTLPVPHEDVLGFWRFALRCRAAHRSELHPWWTFTTRAPDFLKWLGGSSDVNRLIARSGARAHLVLVALWLIWEYRSPQGSEQVFEELEKHRRRTVTRSTALRRRRRAGLDPAPRGRPVEWLSGPVLSVVLSDLWHEASGGRYRGWETIRRLLRDVCGLQYKNRETLRRSAVRSRRDHPKHQEQVAAYMADWVRPTHRRLIRTGLL
jgi:hypothetical protein